MTVRVGVIGAGAIGQDHIRRITGVLRGGAVVAVADIDADRAKRAASTSPGAAVYRDGRDLVSDSHVDAVLVASWGPAHEEHVLASIGAGKPVFCEKPLAPTTGACLRIIEAEVATGRRFVQVGFMRRYDPAYQQLKAVLADGGIGAPLLMHCAHRNPSAPPYRFTTETMITDSAVHEIDIARWLFGEEIAGATIVKPRRSSKAGADQHDPLIVLLEMTSGVLVDVEVFVNAGYGYDIQGEIVAERGTVALAGPDGPVVRTGGQLRGHVPADWRERFGRSYDAELQAWLDSVATGTPTGPSSWDGYAAAAVTDSCIEALRTGKRTAVTLADRPRLYAEAQCQAGPHAPGT